MKVLIICLVIYLAALSVFLWGIAIPKKPKPFIPVDIRFCQDWRDGQASFCDEIPFRSEVSV
jgi:hypothetical protein